MTVQPAREIDGLLAKSFRTANEQNECCLIQYIRNQRYIKNQACALMLGAGIGVNIGLPTWDNLLKALILNILSTLTITHQETKTLDTVIARTKTIMDLQESETAILAHINTLEQGEYLSILLESVAREFGRTEGHHEEYVKPTTRALMVAMLQSTLSAFYRNAEQLNNQSWQVHETLCYFLTRENNIKHVLCYNFDDGLEYALYKRLHLTGVASLGLNDSIFHEPEEKANIYHVHGRARFLTGDYAQDNREGIIFDEDSYLAMERVFYNTANVCQAQVLRSHHCFLIGLSMQDYSMRRILRGMSLSENYTKKIDQQIERKQFYCTDDDGENDLSVKKHFVLYPINSLISNITGKKEINAADLTQGQINLLEDFMSFQAAYFMKRGLFPLFTTYRDIPLVLADILHQTG